MKEEQILAAACIYVNCTSGQVLAHHIYEDCITLVVDRGIAGGPKYTVPLAELEKLITIATRLGSAMGKGVVQTEPPEVKIDIDDSIIIPHAEGINITRAALRLAESRGVELTMITGSGNGGRILKRDVEALL